MDHNSKSPMPASQCKRLKAGKAGPDCNHIICVRQHCLLYHCFSQSEQACHTTISTKIAKYGHGMESCLGMQKCTSNHDACATRLTHS